MAQIPAPIWISRKHRNLVNNPLGEKLVTAVPGIGPAGRRNLAVMGITPITRASQLLEMYLEDPLNFHQMLKARFRVHANYAGQAYNALRDIQIPVPAPIRLPPRLSRKHRDLVNNPLEGKLVTAVPGIGLAAKHNLADKRITRASQLLGMYLRDPSNFHTMLMQTFGVYANSAGKAYNALRDFSNTHIHNFQQ